MRMKLFRIVGVVSLGVVMPALGLWSASVKAESALPAPGGPNIFLRFLESFQTEDAVTADAYYKAVDPYNRRLTLKAWLVTTGFLESLDTPWTGSGSGVLDTSPGTGDSNIRVD